MIKGQVASRYIEGTSALKFDGAKPGRASILAFPLAAEQMSSRAGARNFAAMLKATKGRLRSILEASEMYCSLKFEDFKGCAYGAFSTRGIAVLSISCAVLAAVAVVFGA